MFQILPELKEKLRSRRVIVSMVVIATLLYAGVSFIVVKRLAGSKAGQNFSLPALFGKDQAPTSTPAYPTDEYGRRVSVPTPTPTPAKGPGVYACSFEGVCNLYGDKERASYCKETFADPSCLGQCANKEKRCTR